MSDSLALIDDFESACSLLTPFGRYVVGNACLSVREEIRTAATGRGWQIIDYHDFQHFISRRDYTLTTVVLDPIVCMPDDSQRFIRLRGSRVREHDRWKFQFDSDVCFNGLQSKSINLIDDVAASGSTLKAVIEKLRNDEIEVANIAVCTGTSRARRAIDASALDIVFDRFVDRDILSVHLRDACPFLPFSGRPPTDRICVDTGLGKIAVRFPCTTLKRGPWPLLFAVPRVLSAVIRARSEVSHILSKSLDRDATVSDLIVFGDSVSIPAYPHHVINADTLLRDIV